MSGVLGAVELAVFPNRLLRLPAANRLDHRRGKPAVHESCGQVSAEAVHGVLGGQIAGTKNDHQHGVQEVVKLSSCEAIA